MLEEGPPHCGFSTARAELGRSGRVPLLHLGIKLTDPFTEGDCEASTQAMNIRKHRAHSVYLMIITSREIQKLGVHTVLLKSHGKQGEGG